MSSSTAGIAPNPPQQGQRVEDQQAWETARLIVAGRPLRVASRGSGPPLLLVMGIGGNLDMWTPLVSRIDGRRLIAFDAPGTGESDTGRPLRMRGLADLIARLLDELGLDHVDVLGVSFGGALAQELAHRHPQRVRRLVLAATACGLVGVPPRPSVYLHMAHPLRYYSKTYLRWVSPRIYGGRARRGSMSSDQQASLRLHAPPSLLGYASQLFAVAGWTSLPWLHRLQAPTLIMAGDDDPIIPLANARLLAWRIPDARLHVIRGGGHLFLLDQLEDVIDPLEAFLGAAPVTAG